VTNLFFWAFLILVIGGLASVLSRPEKIYEYPHFMAAVFAVFILPQAVSLLRFPGAAPEEAVRRVMGMTCLCLGACLVGYRRSRTLNQNQSRAATGAINQDKLLLAGLVFVGCGFVFSFVLARIEVQTSELGGWTGPATIYAFFQQLCYPGFAICFMVALRQPTSFSLAATILASLVPIQSVIFGRREPAALFAMIVGLTLYFQLRLRPSCWLIATCMGLAMLAIPATATYRRYQLDQDWDAVRQVDWIGNFRDFLTGESVLELRNAAMLIEATGRSGEYELGAGYWNHLVFRYIPAQILGPKFKEMLMIERPREGLERELAAMGYVNPAGSTVTGMGDSFQQFGYCGCLFFAALGLGFRFLWRATAPSTALFAQLLYMQSCTSAMRAVTHWTLDFLPGFLYSVIFLGLAAWYARPTSKFDMSIPTTAYRRGRRPSPKRPPAPAHPPHFPSALATMKISIAPPKPPPNRRYSSE